MSEPMRVLQIEDSTTNAKLVLQALRSPGASIEAERVDLYMSGYADDAALRHGVVEAGIFYLQKPLTVETLTRRVREVLDSPKSP